MRQPGEAALEVVLRRPTREAWPLTRVLNALSMKMGRTGLLAKPRRGPQAGKSGDPRSHNADNSDLYYAVSRFYSSPAQVRATLNFLLH